MFPLKNFWRNIKKAALEPSYAFRALIRRTGAYLNYRFGKQGRSSYPESITFFLTYRCNLRCHMCGQWGDAGTNKLFDAKKLASEVSIDNFRKLISEVAFFKPHITLFGGEPLMYGEAHALIREIKKKGLHLGIITNGVLLKQYASTMVESGLDELSISVDGPQDAHDDIRNLKGAFAKIREGVAELNRLKEEKGVSKPIINLVCTISSRNYTRLHEMTAVAEEFKAHTLNFHHLIHTDTATVKAHNEEFKELFGCESKDWEGFVMTDMTLIKTDLLETEIKQIKKDKHKFMVSFYPNFEDSELRSYYSDPKFLPKSYSGRCLSPWIVAYIYPDGSVLPCHSLGYSVGNINEKPFLDIWNGEELRGFRKELKKRGHFKVCPKCTEMYRY